MPRAKFSNIDLYAVLGLEPQATVPEIKKAFQSLSLIHHPDKTGPSEEVHEHFVKIVNAYEVLSDEASKAVYDNERASTEAASTQDRSSSRGRRWSPYPKPTGKTDNSASPKRNKSKLPHKQQHHTKKAADSSVDRLTVLSDLLLGLYGEVKEFAPFSEKAIWIELHRAQNNIRQAKSRLERLSQEVNDVPLSCWQESYVVTNLIDQVFGLATKVSNMENVFAEMRRLAGRVEASDSHEARKLAKYNFRMEVMTWP